MRVEVIILAAGEGARMRSTLPKTLHPVGGKPMLAHVIAAANTLDPAKIHVVIGHHGEQVKAAIEGVLAAAAEQVPGESRACAKLHWVTQKEPLGTGHAVMQAMPNVNSAAIALLLYGDAPLISADTLGRLLAAVENPPQRLGLLSVIMQNPAGLGRIVRDPQGGITRIVEEKDADEAHGQIRECNAGFIAAPADLLAAQLAKLDSNNAQKEFYLTDIIGHAAAAGIDIIACQPATIDETLGVNSQADLARAERIHQLRQARALLDQGVRLRDPARFDVRGECRFGDDCVVDINVILEGDVTIGDGVTLGANTIIRDSRIGAGSAIEANCVIDNAIIGERCAIGPFSRLRPHTVLDHNVRIGNFVEIKQSRLGRGSKANHLSYVGDSEIGAGVNIGAGVITCNYDGANKHRTVIGDDVLVGSNSQLVAPLSIGAGATVGAGSTITNDIAAKTLAVGRARQRVVGNWRRPVKKK